MSDYLSNLIARSFDRTEVIQPLLPSRFEPLQQLEAIGIETEDLELEREDRSLQSPRTSLISDLQSLKPNVPGQSSTTDLPLTSSSQPTSEESVESVAPPLLEQKLTPTQIVRQHFVDRVNESQKSTATDNPQSESTFLPKDIASSQTSPVIRPQIVSLPQSGVSPIPMAMTDPPTINITIGRIDVRAIAPSSSPQQTPKSPTPNLSLADYLSRKGGGS